MNGKHISIDYLELLHRLGIVRYQLTIVVNVLRGRSYGAFGLDGFAKGRKLHFGEDVQREKVVILPLLGIVYI